MKREELEAKIRVKFRLFKKEVAINELMPLIDQYVAEELDDLLHHGHGGGNWRRLIETKRAGLTRGGEST